MGAPPPGRPLFFHIDISPKNARGLASHSHQPPDGRAMENMIIVNKKCRFYFDISKNIYNFAQIEELMLKLISSEINI